MITFTANDIKAEDIKIGLICQNIATILSVMPADTLHLLEEQKLGAAVRDLITAEIRRRTEAVA